jgi:hypothetical protein
METIHDIKPRGSDSMVAIAPFDKAKKRLEELGYQVISLEENAQLRIQEGVDTYVSRNGNWVREEFQYNPKTNLWYLTKDSQIMKHPTQATNAHRNGIEYFIKEKQLSSDSVQVMDRKIPTSRFGEDPLTVYAFGEIAKEYGSFLKHANIDEIKIWLPDNTGKKPYARPVWFRNVYNGSDLVGGNRNLHFDDRLRGVVRSQKNSTGNQS